MNAFLLVEIFDDRSIFAGELLEFFFATGIGKAAAVKNEAAAVATFVVGQFAMKREATDADDEIVCFIGDAEKFLRAKHAFKRSDKRRKLDGQFDVVQEPAKIF